METQASAQSVESLQRIRRATMDTVTSTGRMLSIIKATEPLSVEDLCARGTAAVVPLAH